MSIYRRTYDVKAASLRHGERSAQDRLGDAFTTKVLHRFAARAQTGFRVSSRGLLQSN